MDLPCLRNASSHVDANAGLGSARIDDEHVHPITPPRCHKAEGARMPTTTTLPAISLARCTTATERRRWRGLRREACSRPDVPASGDSLLHHQVGISVSFAIHLITLQAASGARDVCETPTIAALRHAFSTVWLIRSPAHRSSPIASRTSRFSSLPPYTCNEQDPRNAGRSECTYRVNGDPTARHDRATKLSRLAPEHPRQHGRLRGARILPNHARHSIATLRLPQSPRLGV